MPSDFETPPRATKRAATDGIAVITRRPAHCNASVFARPSRITIPTAPSGSSTAKAIAAGAALARSDRDRGRSEGGRRHRRAARIAGQRAIHRERAPAAALQHHPDQPQRRQGQPRHQIIGDREVAVAPVEHQQHGRGDGDGRHQGRGGVAKVGKPAGAFAGRVGQQTRRQFEDGRRQHRFQREQQGGANRLERDNTSRSRRHGPPAPGRSPCPGPARPAGSRGRAAAWISGPGVVAAAARTASTASPLDSAKWRTQ